MAKKKVNNSGNLERKTFFCDNVTAAALDLYSTYKNGGHNSEIVIEGLKKVIPKEFFEMAQKSKSVEEVSNG